jgi:hypothetical protein
MCAADAANTEWLAGVIDQIGWPTTSMVGADAATAVFLLVQHSPDQDFQKRCLPLLEAAVTHARRRASISPCLPADYHTIVRSMRMAETTYVGLNGVTSGRYRRYEGLSTGCLGVLDTQTDMFTFIEDDWLQNFGGFGTVFDFERRRASALRLLVRAQQLVGKSGPHVRPM